MLIKNDDIVRYIEHTLPGTLVKKIETVMPGDGKLIVFCDVNVNGDVRQRSQINVPYPLPEIPQNDTLAISVDVTFKLNGNEIQQDVLENILVEIGDHLEGKYGYSGVLTSIEVGIDVEFGDAESCEVCSALASIKFQELWYCDECKIDIINS